MNRWDAQYERGEGLRFWPNEDLVRFIGRHYGMVEDHVRQEVVLELGCGNGANTWFLSRLGFEVVALDQSASALALAARRMKTHGGCMAPRFVRGDIRDGTFFKPGTYDLIIDVMAMQHLTYEEHLSVYKQVRQALSDMGRFFSVHLGADTIGYAQIFPSSGPACLIREDKLESMLEAVFGWDTGGEAKFLINSLMRTYQPDPWRTHYHVIEAEK